MSAKLVLTMLTSMHGYITKQKEGILINKKNDMRRRKFHLKENGVVKNIAIKWYIHHAKFTCKGQLMLFEMKFALTFATDSRSGTAGFRGRPALSSWWTTELSVMEEQVDLLKGKISNDIWSIYINTDKLRRSNRVHLL